jgi:hypothetical protein
LPQVTAVKRYPVAVVLKRLAGQADMETSDLAGHPLGRRSLATVRK